MVSIGDAYFLPPNRLPNALAAEPEPNTASTWVATGSGNFFLMKSTTILTASADNSLSVLGADISISADLDRTRRFHPKRWRGCQRVLEIGNEDLGRRLHSGVMPELEVKAPAPDVKGHLERFPAWDWSR